jgi:hypothetical protein
MRKLVLGIIAVSVLQIAFLLQSAASWWAAPPPSVVYVPIFTGEKTPELSRTQTIEPETSETISPQNPSEDPDTRTRSVRRPAPVKRDTQGSRVDPREYAGLNTRPVREERKPAAPVTRVAKPDRRFSQPKWNDTAAGSTMLIEYRQPTIKTANAEVRTKKRSWIAKVFTPIVKKPWHLMKSIASKLD